MATFKFTFIVIFCSFSLWISAHEPQKQEKIPFKNYCSPQVEPGVTCVDCTLRQWAKKIFSLKERPTEIAALPTKDTYEASILTLNDLLGSIERCAHILENSCKDNACWLKGESLQEKVPALFHLRRETYPVKEWSKNYLFKPYAQKLIVAPGSSVIFFGDLHGSMHSLMRILLKLQRDGILSNTFKIRRPNTSLVFLGDYVDRGIYGTEIVYTLMRLKLANPQTVYLVRGNHEDYGLALEFAHKYKGKEPKEKAPSFLDELDRKFGISCKDETIIYRFYDILPVVLYLGCQAQGHTNFIQCCHGGFELGYDPQKFLQADTKITYDRIEVLWRKKHFYTKLTERQQQMVKKNFDIPSLCSDIVNLVPRGPFYTRLRTGQPFGFGFTWNDFYTDSTQEVGPRNKAPKTGKNTFGAWVYGKDLTQTLLSWGNSKAATLRAVLRAHQHNNDTGGPMLNLLCCTKGIVNVWGENIVYTLVSSPDAKLEDTGERCFTYDSYLVLTTAPQYKDWKFNHYYRDGSIARDKWHKVQVNFGYRPSIVPVPQRKVKIAR